MRSSFRDDKNLDFVVKKKASPLGSKKFNNFVVAKVRRFFLRGPLGDLVVPFGRALLLPVSSKEGDLPLLAPFRVVASFRLANLEILWNLGQ